MNIYVAKISLIPKLLYQKAAFLVFACCTVTFSANLPTPNTEEEKRSERCESGEKNKRILVTYTNSCVACYQNSLQNYQERATSGPQVAD